MEHMLRCVKCNTSIVGPAVCLYEAEGFSLRFCSRSCLFLWLAAQLKVTFSIGVKE